MNNICAMQTLDLRQTREAGDSTAVIDTLWVQNGNRVVLKECTQLKSAQHVKAVAQTVVEYHTWR